MGLRDFVMGRDRSVSGQILRAYDDMLKLVETEDYLNYGTTSVEVDITKPLLKKIDGTLKDKITNNPQSRAIFAEVTRKEIVISQFAKENLKFVKNNKIEFDPKMQTPNKHEIIAQLQIICDGIKTAGVSLKSKIATEVTRIQNLDESPGIRQVLFDCFDDELGQLLDPLDQYEKLLNKFRSLPLVALGILAASWLVGKSLSTRSDSKNSIV